jgi:LysM repeat protein
MTATIGIKIANGEYYSILEENSSVKKRLILTTVHDNQRSVQIDLYRSFALSMADAQYIGSLVVEKIQPKSKGEPSIELVISSNSKGDITAEALDLDTGHSGEHQILTVSLKSLDEHIKEYEIPDFELEHNDEPPTGLYAKAQAIQKKESRKFPWMVLIIIGIVIVLALAAVWFFFFGGKDAVFSGKKEKPAVEQTVPAEPPTPAEKTPPPVTQKTETPAQPPLIKAPKEPPPAQPPVQRKRPPAPVSSYKVPATIPREGAPYTIRWGDTLWDISEAFYRNPWLYPRIARFNNIRNPNHIIAGRTIRIPPKN